MSLARVIAVLVLVAFASGCTPAMMVPAQPASATSASYPTPLRQERAEGYVQFGQAQETGDEPTPSPMMAEPKKHDGGLSAGAVVGIVGGVLGAGMMALLVYGLVSLGNSMKSFGSSMNGFSFNGM